MSSWACRERNEITLQRRHGGAVGSPAAPEVRISCGPGGCSVSAWVHSGSCAKKRSPLSTRLWVLLLWLIFKAYIVRILSRQLMEVVLPADAHRLATDRLHVSITNVKSGKNHLVSTFSSRDELITVHKPTETFNLQHWYTLSAFFYTIFLINCAYI